MHATAGWHGRGRVQGRVGFRYFGEIDHRRRKVALSVVDCWTRGVRRCAKVCVKYVGGDPGDSVGACGTRVRAASGVAMSRPQSGLDPRSTARGLGFVVNAIVVLACGRVRLVSLSLCATTVRLSARVPRPDGDGPADPGMGPGRPAEPAPRPAGIPSTSEKRRFRGLGENAPASTVARESRHSQSPSSSRVHEKE